jgi:hypothetical protein
MMYAYDFISYFAQAEGNPFPAVNASVAGAALQQCFKVSGNRFGGWHTVKTH